MGYTWTRKTWDNMGNIKDSRVSLITCYLVERKNRRPPSDEARARREAYLSKSRMNESCQHHRQRLLTCPDKNNENPN